MQSIATKNTTLNIYFQDIKRYPLLSPEEEFNIATDYYHNKTTTAAYQLITSNLRYVVKVANQYKHYHHNLMDLIQEGNIGLMLALKKFDPYRGKRFILYAVDWIHARIKQFVMHFWSIVKLGTNEKQKRLFWKAKQEVEDNVDGVDEIRLAMDGHTDVDDLASILHDGRRTIEDALVEKSEVAEVRAKFRKAFAKLNEREQHVCRWRFLEENKKTYRELAIDLGISRQRVDQLEKGLMKKLKVGMGVNI